MCSLHTLIGLRISSSEPSGLAFMLSAYLMISYYKFIIRFILRTINKYLFRIKIEKN